MPNGSSKPGVMLQRDLNMFYQGPDFQVLIFVIGTGCTLTLTGSVTMTLARAVLSFTEHPLRTWADGRYSKILRRYFLVLKRNWTPLSIEYLGTFLQNDGVGEQALLYIRFSWSLKFYSLCIVLCIPDSHHNPKVLLVLVGSWMV